MLNFIRNFVIGMLGIFLFLWLLSRSSGWNKLSKKYKVEQCSPDIFITNQQGVFRNPDNNRSSTVIRPLNIGVSEEGLYLFKASYNAFYPSLLIPWSEIEYQPSYNDKYTFYIGNPVITCLTIYPRIIRKLEEDYGEPIFSNKLGELN